MNAAWTIAASLDRHLLEKTEIVVFGSAALLLDQIIDGIGAPPRLHLQQRPNTYKRPIHA